MSLTPTHQRRSKIILQLPFESHPRHHLHNRQHQPPQSHTKQGASYPHRPITRSPCQSTPIFVLPSNLPLRQTQLTGCPRGVDTRDWSSGPPTQSPCQNIDILPQSPFVCLRILISM
ncbi:hypothetical protein I7I50_04768 [Histoplasma capsulatum G186AR]|uniref:Uncharacterized protein n=1 Tax=Ajellomyces capsulatus TaxID=5037 RepID=A0A8H7YN46_AJECA|nr:hypothetical protein I7I52_05677 [Histoplasma capsulatum]QSS75585.1 hypothetical protein I7I50_04768 [Histoplasma capsulatum G186AR]